MYRLHDIARRQTICCFKIRYNHKNVSFKRFECTNCTAFTIGAIQRLYHVTRTSSDWSKNGNDDVKRSSKTLGYRSDSSNTTSQPREELDRSLVGQDVFIQEVPQEMTNPYFTDHQSGSFLDLQQSTAQDTWREKRQYQSDHVNEPQQTPVEHSHEDSGRNLTGWEQFENEEVVDNDAEDDGLDFYENETIAPTSNTASTQLLNVEDSKPFEASEGVNRSKRKTDLSYHDPRQRELAAVNDGITASPHRLVTKFRGNSGMRRIVHQYIHIIEPLLDQSSISKRKDALLEQQLARVFTDDALTCLELQGYTIEDVVSWSWILGAENAAQSIRRYVYWVQKCRSSQQSPPPLFLSLQLLRADRIDARSLNMFITEIEVALDNGYVYRREPGTILLIRLLRHARLVDVVLYDRITELASRVLPLQVNGDAIGDLQRLTHFYNRFLSLLSLPVARHPFLSVDTQQRAQLKIVRLMTRSDYDISLNREGYRAMARLQLMHKKTAEEQRWSSVKAPSWPPWRHDELGIDARLEYSGQQSRVSKVIQRLLEAGYGPESMEHEAQIMAGWDTDKSPTVQVRRMIGRRPLSWIRNVLREGNVKPGQVDYHLWAARVAATRSVREAWVAFYSYMQETLNQKRHLKVYHEMFRKLFARTQSTNPRSLPSPGDGKEIFPDPLSTRDLVYVPKEPPSVDELYEQMLQDGIRPAGRLLADLIDNANTLKKGLDYVRASSIGDVKIDLLLHPEKYPRFSIRNMFSSIPQYLLASYLGLLTNRLLGGGVQLFAPGSRSAEEGTSRRTRPIRPFDQGMELFHIWQTTYLPAYHAVLEGLYTQTQAKYSKTNIPSPTEYPCSILWNTTKEVLLQLEKQNMEVDLTCFRKVVLLFRSCVIKAPHQFKDGDNRLANSIPYIKSIFAKAVGGQIEQGELCLPPGKTLSVGQQPYWKDVESLILMLGFSYDSLSIIDLLRWLHNEQEHLECVNGNGYKRHRLACAVRVAMEAMWNESASGADAKSLQQARAYTATWTWPEDVDVREFMQHHRTWFQSMRAATSNR